MAYSNFAIAFGYQALNYAALIPSSIPMVLYNILVIVSYYSLSHIIPWPNQLEVPD